MTRLDQVGDTNLTDLHRYNKLYGLPDFVKRADTNAVYTPPKDTPALYADVRQPRQFPLHTKAATYVSLLYFLEKQSEINSKVRPMIEERINRAVDYWGIKNAAAELRARVAAANKQAEYPDSAYAIVLATTTGQKDRRYPMRNALETKVAAAWFNQYLPQIREEFPFADRKKIATKILEKAAAFGAALPAEHIELLEAQAGRGICSPTKTAKAIRDRVKVAHRVQKEVAAGMLKLADTVEHKPKAFLDPASASDLASTLDQFDRTHGLLNKYSAAIPAPEAVVFEATYTKLSALRDSACRTVTGSVYSTDDFEKISLTDISGLFGDELAKEVANGLKVDVVKLAEIISTLPRSEAEMFDDLAADRGLTPLAKEAGYTTGFSFADLQTMAAVPG